MKEFIEYIIKNLVDQPEAVIVNCVDEDPFMRIEVRVDANEIGKVVGKKGITIKAIRMIAMIACARLGYRVRVELISRIMDLISCSVISGCDRRTPEFCSSSIASAMNSSQSSGVLGLAPKYHVPEIKPLPI